MDFNDICINCFKPTGGEEVCMNCGFIQTDKPKQICHLYPKTVLNNRYLIGTVINNGGFGVVYKAYDMRLERVVAIKELLPTQNSMVTRLPPSLEVISVNDERKETFEKLKMRFKQEGRVIAQFSDCNSIVRVFDVFETNNTVYMVMEYLDGMTLRQYIDNNEQPMRFDTVLNILMPVLQALKVIHQAGVVHKDVSPDNIFICNDGSVKLIDFGAAQFNKDDAQSELSSSVVLKVGYTPPEQYRTNAVVTPASDIYSIGAVFYAVLTGKVPPESIDRIENDELQRLSKCGIDIPLYADKAIMKAMALKEAARFKSVDEFIDAVTGKKKAEFPEVEIRKKKIRNIAIISLIIVVLATSVFATYLIKSLNSIVPKTSATIELWYMDTGDKEIEKRWNKVVSDFIKFAGEQNSELKNTKVVVKAIPEKEYESKLEEAFKNDKAPAVYQSVGDKFDKHAASLKPLVSEAKNQEMTPAYEKMLEEYEAHKQIAVCFDMPVLYTYINNASSKVPDASTTLDNLLMAKKPNGFSHSLICNPQAIVPAAYAYGNGSYDKNVADKLYGASKTTDTNGKYVSPRSIFVKDKKSEQKAMYYIGMMSEYGDIYNGIPLGVSGFDVSHLTDKNVSDLYVFPELWSISNQAGINQRNTAMLLLYFMLCNVDGQYDMTHIGSSTYYLPMLANPQDLKLIDNDDYSFIYKNASVENAKTIPYNELEDASDKTQVMMKESKKSVD